MRPQALVPATAPAESGTTDTWGSLGLRALVCLAGRATFVLPPPAIFVDTGIEVIFDGKGRATALRITSTSDEA